MDAARTNETLLRAPAELVAGQFELLVRRMAEDLTYGSDASRFVGSGTEYAQTRMFALGDPVRAIDWRVTARTGKVHVKDYQATKRVPLFLIVDTSASMGVRSSALSKHDVAVWVAGVLAVVGLHRRSPVSLLAGGDRFDSQSDEHGRPTLSRSRVWQGLLSLRGQRDGEGTDLARAIERIEGTSRVASVVGIVSDLHDPASLGAIKRIGQRHDVFVAQIVDPAEVRGVGAGFVRAREAETGRAFVPRRGGAQGNAGAELVGAGVDHVVVRTDEPILTPLRKLFDLRGGLGRNAR